MPSEKNFYVATALTSAILGKMTLPEDLSEACKIAVNTFDEVLSSLEGSKSAKSENSRIAAIENKLKSTLEKI